MEEKPKIIPLGERRRDKGNEGKRDGVEITPDGYILYPEEKIDITVDEALMLAKQVIKEYSDPEALFRDYATRERNNPSRQFYERTDDGTLRKELETLIAHQRSYAALGNMDSLMIKMDFHKKNPNHYYGTVVLATAEELKRDWNLRRLKDPYFIL